MAHRENSVGRTSAMSIPRTERRDWLKRGILSRERVGFV
jgi:hypothetical protein